MPILSGGTLLIATPGSTWGGYGTSTTYYPGAGLTLIDLCASHAAIYRKQVWVYTVVRKLATATARLPLKVYRRQADGSRVSASDTAYAGLLSRPNPRMDPFYFWLWTASTMEVYGEAMWAKIRGRNGGVSELWPMHPSKMYVRRDDVSGEVFYGCVDKAQEPQFEIPSRDVVHFRSYNPDDTLRGMSPLEPLRQTLLNEDAARRATSAFWQNGARPAVALKHPGNLSQPAAERLKARWEAIAAGVDNTGKTVVLEEGMEAQVMSLSAEESQYIETRKLNREEVCGAYDVPPPVVHILDRATFSNITEQMRSMYRDTMAPRLSLFESVLDQQLRPEFDRDGTIYAEFLLDEVLRGAFEDRVQAIATAVQTGQLTINEGRTIENRPAVDGGDVLLINSAMVPLGSTATPDADMPAEVVRSVTDRAARRKSLAEIDPAALVAGCNGSSELVLARLAAARSVGASVPEFCADLWRLVKE